MSVLSDQDESGLLKCLGSLAVISCVMYGRRVYVAVSDLLQLLLEVDSVELLRLLTGEVGRQVDLASKGLLVRTQS